LASGQSLKRRLKPLVVAALTALVFCPRLCAGGKLPPKAPAPSRAQQIIPSDSELVIRAIISAKVAPTSDQHIDDVLDLMIIFDHENRSADLKKFASLSDFYLGEWPGELYSCLAMRKGPRLLPYLSEALRSGNSACAERLSRDFSSKSRLRGTGNIGASLCLSPTEHERRIEDLVRQINSKTRCSDGDLAEMTGL
jgi:hypothetical protein